MQERLLTAQLETLGTIRSALVKEPDHAAAVSGAIATDGFAAEYEKMEDPPLNANKPI
eukprot:NODE_2577_length_769_cov_95.381944_g1417_i1.p6 GENE.NODE_2577_length_769_cov_95.381944_g1417_i1~~NODE_2577_length_769_cov_95.381944_g1417_i1.p6  ORF type:complete len:58 (-),score=22.77 NODE_2577_length_769_cov_95.381944_g1417_i1:360-533(-)